MAIGIRSVLEYDWAVDKGDHYKYLGLSFSTHFRGQSNMYVIGTAFTGCINPSTASTTTAGLTRHSRVFRR